MNKIVVITLLFALFTPYLAMARDNGWFDTLMPNSPFYFIKAFKERLLLILTLDPQKRAEKAFEYSKEKISEMQQMTNLNNPEALRKALSSYQYYIGVINSLASQKGVNINDIKQKLDSYSKNDEALRGIYQNLPPANKSSLRLFLNRGVVSFKNIFVFLFNSLFQIKAFFQNLILKL